MKFNIKLKGSPILKKTQKMIARFTALFICIQVGILGSTSSNEKKSGNTVEYLMSKNILRTQYEEDIIGKNNSLLLMSFEKAYHILTVGRSFYNAIKSKGSAYQVVLPNKTTERLYKKS